MKNSLDVEGTWEGPVILFHPVCGTHDYAYIHRYIYIYIDIHSIFILICIHKGYMPCIPSCGNRCWPGDLGAWGPQCFQVQAEVVQVKMEKRAMDAEQETCTMWSPTADHMTKCSYSDVFHRFFTVGNPIQLLHVIFFSGTIISIMPQAS